MTDDQCRNKYNDHCAVGERPRNSNARIVWELLSRSSPGRPTSDKAKKYKKFVLMRCETKAHSVKDEEN